ncbi:hypothetical protein D3C71_1782800 [compost metagenome]
MPEEGPIVVQFLSQHWSQSRAIRIEVLLISRVASRPDGRHIATTFEFPVEGHLGLRGAQIDDRSTGLQDRIEFLNEFAKVIASGLSA